MDDGERWPDKKLLRDVINDDYELFRQPEVPVRFTLFNNFAIFSAFFGYLTNYTKKRVKCALRRRALNKRLADFLRSVNQHERRRQFRLPEYAANDYVWPEDGYPWDVRDSDREDGYELLGDGSLAGVTDDIIATGGRPSKYLMCGIINNSCRVFEEYDERLTDHMEAFLHFSLCFTRYMNRKVKSRRRRNLFTQRLSALSIRVTDYPDSETFCDSDDSDMARDSD